MALFERPDERFAARLVDRPLQTFPELDRRLPVEDLPCQRDVRTPLLRIIGRQGLVDDLRARASDVDHRLGQLEQRELLRIADVDGLVVP